MTKTEKKLTKAKDRAERWKEEAKAQKRSAARAGARVKKLQQKQDRASAEPTDADGVTVPDETWSVVQLRAEARARGLVGTSNKPKAQLLAALS